MNLLWHCLVLEIADKVPRVCGALFCLSRCSVVTFLCISILFDGKPILIELCLVFFIAVCNKRFADYRSNYFASTRLNTTQKCTC